MKKNLLLSLVVIFCGMFCLCGNASASSGVNLKISPVSNYFTVKAGDVQNYTLTITNDGDEEFSYKLYAAPYVVTDDEYSVNFSEENATHYNQISRWITFKNEQGSYENTVVYKVAPGESQTVLYRVSVPDDIPEGGQYCVIFAESINETEIESSGITAITRVAMTLVGHGAGLTNQSAEIIDFNVSHPFSREGITASSKVKNNGNTDFEASYAFTVKTIFDKTVYTDSSSYTILPETERKFGLSWADAPVFGLFKVTFAVSASDAIREETHLVFIVPIFVIVIMLLLLTAAVIWIIILVRKREERSSRLVV